MAKAHTIELQCPWIVAATFVELHSAVNSTTNMYLKKCKYNNLISDLWWTNSVITSLKFLLCDLSLLID